MPPERRDLAVVFQNYALWPHLSAVDTVAYPVRRRGAGRAQARAEALEICSSCCGSRTWPTGGRPSCPAGSSSGSAWPGRWPGVRRCTCSTSRPPTSTPTSARVFLDELVARRRDSGAAAVYATHDAEEALGLADRVALLRDGRLLQVGTPQQVYDEPVDLFAARLTGPASVIDAPTGRAGCWCGRGGRGSAARWTGRVRAVRFRGPHSDHLVETPLGRGAHPRARTAGHAGRRATGWTLLRGWPIAG